MHALKTTEISFFFFLILDKNWLYLFIYFVINSTLTCHQGSSEFRTEIFPIKGLQ